MGNRTGLGFAESGKPSQNETTTFKHKFFWFKLKNVRQFKARDNGYRAIFAMSCAMDIMAAMQAKQSFRSDQRFREQQYTQKRDKGLQESQERELTWHTSRPSTLDMSAIAVKEEIGESHCPSAS
jgi:hypothetical protein